VPQLILGDCLQYALIFGMPDPPGQPRVNVMFADFVSLVSQQPLAQLLADIHSATRSVI
jgi:hypothetical protein